MYTLLPEPNTCVGLSVYISGRQFTCCESYLRHTEKYAHLKNIYMSGPLNISSQIIQITIAQHACTIATSTARKD